VSTLLSVPIQGGSSIIVTRVVSAGKRTSIFRTAQDEGQYWWPIFAAPLTNVLHAVADIFATRLINRGGVNGDFYFFDVDLMRGSADFLNNHAPVPQQNDYSQYELEIARLRDEIEALRQQNAEQV
jgi:hypothetical protein